MSLYDQLSPEGKTLLREAHGFLRKGYDPVTHLVSVDSEGSFHIGIRESMYYALSLMILNREWDTVEAVTRAVLALQMDAPGEVFHGAFRHSPSESAPAAGVLDAARLGTDGRYFADLAWERTTSRFSRLLESRPELSGRSGEIEALLHQALTESVPVAWDSYEPNTREFILMCLAMLLEHEGGRLPKALTEEIARCARLGMEGAVARSLSGFTPLNTNILCMHIFLLDYFGRRLGNEEWTALALTYAEAMLRQYREYHACAEFNSPTYCGVDLSTLGFVRRYSPRPELVRLADELEEGIWQDVAEFYNPAMRNFCGPYSRAYELDCAVHTCFYDLMYLGLGESLFPWHPFSVESVCNPLLLLGDVRIPEAVRPALFEDKQDVRLRHSFRELSERGDPQRNNALCTATGWISPRLMTGALAGSENPSYQLHPLVIFWRSGEALGTVSLHRCLPDGRMQHMRTVLFNGQADRNRLTMDVEARVTRDVDVFFEISCPGLDPEQLRESCWTLPGLTIRLSARAPRPEIRRVDEHTLRVVYPARQEDPASLRMHFDLEAELT